MEKLPLKITNARENNLKNLNLEIPHDKLTVITGLSGSGKSSLAFDTIFAEGQRRFIETFSPYTRQFLDKIKKPDVDLIENIRAAIAIQQRTRITTSRSTVGSLTDIIDYLKILWANLAKPTCPECGIELKSWSSDELQKLLEKWQKLKEGSTFYICAPIEATSAKGLRTEIERLISLGFTRTLNIKTAEITLLEDITATTLKKNKDNKIFLLLERIKPDKFNKKLIHDAIEQAFNLSHGGVVITEIKEGLRPLVRIQNNKKQTNNKPSKVEINYFFNQPRCTNGEIILPNISPALFSYNHPHGCCPICKGFGKTLTIDEQKCIPNQNLSIKDGAVHCWNTPSTRLLFNKLIKFCEANSIPTNKPWKSLKPEQKEAIFNTRTRSYLGIFPFFKEVERVIYKMHVRVFLSRYRSEKICPNCHGTRLRPEASAYKIKGKKISDLWNMEIKDLLEWLKTLYLEHEETLKKHQLNGFSKSLAQNNYLADVFDATINRVALLNDLGLSYLTLNRQARTLSGGETQRVNLAAALGSQLTSTQFVLDEPSVGLHPHDTDKLNRAIRDLQEKGNSVLLVEHDLDCISMADHIIELGPEAGENGGELIYSGSPKNWNSFLGETVHLKNITSEDLLLHPLLKIRGANARNLKNINLDIPLEAFVCLSGVSGSGKSTLVNEVIKYEYEAKQAGSESFCSIEGFENISELLIVDQTPLTKAPRANIASYCKIWDIIRNLLANTESARIRKLSKSSFSFNVEGGRCPNCKGAGFIKEDMQFLNDVYIQCDKCLGKRFKEIVLEVKYNELNVFDFLQMSVSACKDFFKEDKFIQSTCETLEILGLGHLTLGHPLSELSGGEAQRLKLIPLLQKTNNAKSLLIFDEPTTGLHNKDINKLIELFYSLRDKGHSLIIIEHNLSLLSAADWIIDLGPLGGEAGGEVINVGTPQEFIKEKNPASLTAKHLARYCDLYSNKQQICHGDLKEYKSHSKISSPAIIIKGAREHNLQNIDLEIPLHKIVAFTGVSGSGKSSIAKDILYAEGQRRYLDCLSPYARQFIKELKRPDIDSISNILPTICVYQHTYQPSQLSTIASMSDVYNYLRLLYSKTGVQYCPDHPQERITPLEVDDITKEIAKINATIKILAPIIKQKKGNHKAVIERAISIDISEIRVDGSFKKPTFFLDEELPKTKPHSIEFVIGSFNPSKVPLDIIKECVSQAINLGNGTLILFHNEDIVYSIERNCRVCKKGFFKPDPEDLSFNSIRGACPKCHGFGVNEKGVVCSACHGSRLNKVASNLRLDNYNIHEACLMTPQELKDFLTQYDFPTQQYDIAKTILHELDAKLASLINLGLNYLPLDRDCSTLSGGELQRLRLATAMGSPLTGILYIFDEPSAGLHPLDNQKVLAEMKDLKEHENSVIIIEHDEESILSADHIIDIGPSGGSNGGKVLSNLPLAEFLKKSNSLTAKALRNELNNQTLTESSNFNSFMHIINGNKHNINGLNLDLPLGVMTTIAGVSGAGKSTLVNGILKTCFEEGKASSDKLCFVLEDTKLVFDSKIDKIQLIDQKPIGANSRSTPASYLGIVDEIRQLFAKTLEAQTRGWNASFFSYNTGKGRCQKCEGRGELKLQMTFLADATIECEECHGERFCEAIKSVKFLDHSIVDVLKMTIEEAHSLFINHSKINHILHTACEIGLGYLTLGQSSTTLSGGESQRLKLVSELSARHKGHTLYILDEPTIGLHRADIGKLITILKRLTSKGNTVLVIEHDKDFIFQADYVVELGPKAGSEGGKLVFQGVPSELRNSSSPWGKLLKK